MLSSFAYAHGGTESGKKQRKDRNRERHFTVLQRKSLFHGTYDTTKLMYMAGALEFLSWKRQTDSATFSYSPNRIPRDFPLVLSHLTRECPCPSVPQREIAAFGTVRRSRERKQFNLGLNSSKPRIKASIQGWIQAISAPDFLPKKPPCSLGVLFRCDTTTGSASAWRRCRWR